MNSSNEYIIAEGHIIKGKYLVDTLRTWKYQSQGPPNISDKEVSMHHRIGPWKYFRKDGSMYKNVIHNGKHQLVTITTFNPETDNEISYEEYQYLQKGRAISFRKEGQLLTDERYHKDGRIKSKILYKRDGSEMETERYKYKGNMLLEHATYRKDTVWRKKEFIYEKKNCIRQINTAEGQETYRLEHEFRNNKKHKTVSFKNGKEAASWLYFYKENGVLEYKEMYENGVKIKTIPEY